MNSKKLTQFGSYRYHPKNRPLFKHEIHIATHFSDLTDRALGETDEIVQFLRIITQILLGTTVLHKESLSYES
jgi:hypothetical protein